MVLFITENTQFRCTAQEKKYILKEGMQFNSVYMLTKNEAF